MFHPSREIAKKRGTKGVEKFEALSSSNIWTRWLFIDAVADEENQWFHENYEIIDHSRKPKLRLQT